MKFSFPWLNVFITSSFVAIQAHSQLAFAQRPRMPRAQPAQTVSDASVARSVVTMNQFEQASQIAMLASENGFMELSLQSIGRALNSGPPIEVMVEADPFAPVQPNQGTPRASQSAILLKVEEQLSKLEQSWRKKGVDDVLIYETLKQAVLPEGRPLEVFPYLRPLTNNPSEPPQSVALLLVRSAIRTGKAEDLRQAIAQRVHQPLGELHSRILLVLLAIELSEITTIREQLEALGARLKVDALASSRELACHVAIPAMNLPDLPPTAVTMLERAVEHFTSETSKGQVPEEPIRIMRFKLAAFHFHNGDIRAGKRHLEEHLRSLATTTRRTGSQSRFRRLPEVMKIAAEYAQAGLASESLTVLGQFVDVASTRNSAIEGSGRAGAVIFANLAQQNPTKLYELLKTWSLPDADRKEIRVYAGLIPGDPAPMEFDALRGSIPRGPRDSQLASTAELLVLSARETGKLDELRGEVQSLANQNVAHARFLLLMIRIAQGEGATLVDSLNEYTEERRAALPAQGDYQKRPQLTDAVLARFAMREPDLVDAGRNLAVNCFVHFTRVQDHLMMTMMRHEYHASLWGLEMSTRLDTAPSLPGLKHWTAGSTVLARTKAAGAMPMWWLNQKGVISHVCGPDQSHLYFKYPLTGTFEISCEAWLGPWAEANMGYGGIAFVGLNLGRDDTAIFPIGNRGDVTQLSGPSEIVDAYNRVTLNVQPDKIYYHVNGKLVHSEPNATSTAPWYFLHCDRAWQTCFRNFQIAGTPTIPREVQLSQRNSLQGWCSEFYGELQPSRNVASADDANPIEGYDWWSKDGIIHGRLSPVTGFGKSQVQQSRLSYDRPLLDGERLKYEFWYEAGTAGTHVNPALDRLAFLLEPDGVNLHWMTDGAGAEDSYSGLLPENRLTDESIRRGKVVLNDKAWNSVDIVLKEQEVVITLNDTVVCERKLEPENSRQFGFYHDKNLSCVKVRNVVLTGDWPESLSPQVLADLAQPDHPPTETERTAMDSVIERKYIDAQ